MGLGSNVGQSRSILGGAIEALREIIGDLSISSVYVTKPRDYADQPDFYNMCATGSFTGSPRELLESLNRIERAWGRDRQREIPKGPRTLDIDIELFGSDIVRDTDLVIPHERLGERLFVLVPLLELLPDSADPVSGELFRVIAGRLPDQGVIKAGAL